MTDWTAEEERVARAIVEAASGPFNVLSVRGKEAAIREARAAIAAMSSWRDVKTDPPPRDAPDWLWYAEIDGNQLVTFGRWPKDGRQVRYKVAPIQPTEHDHPPLPPAPESHDEGR